MPKHLHIGALLLVACVAATMQVRLAMRQSLWADELFSLAMATGHSLEHPASVADRTHGDFVEEPRTIPASAIRRYLEHDTPPAGARRVIRAVALSDTSPPLYYLLLNPWLRLFGASDVALRSFSIAWALASLALLAFVAFRVAGSDGVLPSVVMLGAAPLGLAYATEGRMYSMLWCLALACFALTLEWPRRRDAWWLVAWVVVSSAGLLTHYYFVFPWTACVVWLVVSPETRRRTVGGVVVTCAVIAPWYVMVPRILSQWRVTGDWLNVPLTAREALAAPFALAWNFVAGPRWFGMEISDWVIAAVLGVVAIAALRRSRVSRLQDPVMLVWLWVAATCVGPVALDLVRGTGTARFSRYALAGMPAAMLLMGVALKQLSVRARLIALACLVVACAHGDAELLSTSNRQAEPYREIAESINASSGPSDLVLVHSIPSGVLGIARYLRPDVRVASWVGQLQQRRVPDDVTALTEGASRVVLVTIHEVGAPAAEEAWLRAHATVVEERQQNAGRIVIFAAK